MLVKSKVSLSLEQFGKVLGFPGDSLIVGVGLRTLQNPKGHVVASVEIEVVCAEELELEFKDEEKGD